MSLANVKKVIRGRRERISFARSPEIIELPYLVEIQKDTYKDFLANGIIKVLKEFSPVVDFNQKAQLEFVDITLGSVPKYNESECSIRKQTYSVPLNAKVRLTVKDTGTMTEEDVFIADIPLMNDSGNFTINGVKRVVMTQIARSSGVYFSKTVDKNGKNVYSAKVIPTRGAWIELEQSSGDVLKAVIDKQSKMSIGVFLKSIHLGGDEDLLKIFGNSPVIKNTLDKEPQKQFEDALFELAKKMRPNEVPNIAVTEKYINELFFEQSRYDLEPVGRFKFDKRLGFGYRIAGAVLSRDIISPDGEVLAKAGQVVDLRQAIEIQNKGVNEAWASIEGGKEHKFVGNNRVDIYAYTGFTKKELGFNPRMMVYYPELKRIMTEKTTKEAQIKEIKKQRIILTNPSLTIDDIIAIVGCICDLNAGFGRIDEIDHLGNRRLRPVGETMEKAFRKGVINLAQFIKEKMQVTDFTKGVSAKSLISARQINMAIKEFTQSSPLSHNMDDINALSTLRNKRRLTSVGPGGIDKERAGIDVRDIHYSQYGRICPIETPEGENIGIVLSLANHARIDEFGFIVTPYRKVDKKTGLISNEVEYLSADEEDGFVIASACEEIGKDNKFVNEWVVCRRREEIVKVLASQVDYVDSSSRQFISTVSSLIPFIENDDTSRALMACNMQCQALPLIKTQAPMIATGLESVVARDSGVLKIAKADGVVKYVSANRIVVERNDGTKDEYELIKFEKTNKKTCINQQPLVKKGEKVKAGDVIADGIGTDKGELALGKDVLIAFMNWDGYNFEDSILISERLVKDDVYTSIYISEVSCQATVTKLGDEEITRDIPNVSEEAFKHLDENGIVRIGAEVVPGDILVGKITPKGETELSPEERLLRAIFGEKAREVRDTSLRVDNGQGGIVVDVKILDRKNKDELDNGVNTLVKVFVAQKRKISVGDKMAGRHGNKGVVSRVLPEADMPFLADGTPVDIVLNPLGVPSRMNIGQLLEMHLGLVCKQVGMHIETPSFNGITEATIQELLKDNGLPENGRIQLFDGRTGEAFMNKATVGYMYYLKLEHMVDNKVHARSIGPYALVTRQPLGGKAQNGGQRFGEMEVWALEAYGAAHMLQEMLTVKSDDEAGRTKMLESIVQGTPMGEPGIPEGFKVLLKELQALSFDINVLTEAGKKIDINRISDFDKEAQASDRHDKQKLQEIELETPVQEEELEEQIQDLLSEAMDKDGLDDMFDLNE